MLMVIFGAGASYDSDPRYQPPSVPPYSDVYRPPTANQLFDDRFNSQISKYPECAPLIDELRNCDDIERYLEGRVARSEKYPRIRNELISLRYYLSEVVQLTTQHWHAQTGGVTNYVRLLHQLRDWSEDTNTNIAFATFNYDTLLEKAAEAALQKSLTETKDYIYSHWYKIYKLHGSVDWLRMIHGVAPLTSQEQPSRQFDVLPHSTTLELTTHYAKKDSLEVPAITIGTAFIPAIAVPTATKSGFECPEAHILDLKATLPHITKILIIGWRATERHFLKLWKDIPKQTSNSTPEPTIKHIHIVDRSQEDADNVKNNVVIGTDIHSPTAITTSIRGFTTFVRTDELPIFLGTQNQ